LRIWQIISDVLYRLYRPIELFTQIRTKQIRGYDSAYPKLKDLKENLRYKHRRYLREDDELLFRWILIFLNQNCCDFRKFLVIFTK